MGHSTGAVGWLVEDGGGGLWSGAAVVGGSEWAITMAVRLGTVSEGTRLVERSVVAGRGTSRDDETVMSMVEESSGGQLRGLEGSMLDWWSVDGGVCSRWS